MEVLPSASLLHFDSNNGESSKEVENDDGREISTAESIGDDSNQTFQIPHSNSDWSLRSKLSQTSPSIDNGGRFIKKNKRLSRDVSGYASSSQQRGLRMTRKCRNPKVFIGSGGGFRGKSDLDAVALPLGMAIAAVIAQVLDKNIADERVPADHLSMICTSAVKESLANVFGDRFESFVRNFEKSFGSTLRTLQLINETSFNKGGDSLSHSVTDSYSSEMIQPTSLDGQGHLLSNSPMKNCHSEVAQTNCRAYQPVNFVEEIPENINLVSMKELTLHGKINQQLACVSQGTPGSGFNQSVLGTLQKSVMEQARSNDLKTFEISLIMKRLQLKESQLALNSDSNRLERFKLSMGISKASFRAEKFKNQLEDTRHAELLKKCIDCLVAGLFIMSFSLVYGAYVYSYKRITEATTSCMSPPKESKSWWIPKPVASFNSGLHLLRCQVEVVSRMLFGVLMILAIAYLLLRRSAASNQTMPVTFILLLLGVACGFAGKLCVDTLGGNGYHWLIYWEALCMLHFFANIFTSVLFSILHGSVSVSQGAEANTRLPYWIRRVMFYVTTLLILPLFCGLMPFAGPGDWIDHFFTLTADALFGSYWERS